MGAGNFATIKDSYYMYNVIPLVFYVFIMRLLDFR